MVKESDQKIVQGYFEAQLLEQIKIVDNDMCKDSMTDSIDDKVTQTFRKRQKACTNGHVVENLLQNLNRKLSNVLTWIIPF